MNEDTMRQAAEEQAAVAAGAPPGRMYTAEEASVFLGVSYPAVRGAIRDGRLPFARVYGRNLISESDLIAYRERTAGQKRRGPAPRARATEEATRESE